MLKKDDKDGIIEFLKERIARIRNMARDVDPYYYRSTLDEIDDICDKTLMDVVF